MTTFMHKYLGSRRALQELAKLYSIILHIRFLQNLLTYFTLKITDAKQAPNILDESSLNKQVFGHIHANDSGARILSNPQDAFQEYPTHNTRLRPYAYSYFAGYAPGNCRLFPVPQDKMR